MQAVHFGAGSIGRGFLGQLYFESGFHTTFIDVVPEVVAALNARGGYPVSLVSEAGVHVVDVSNVDAVNGRDPEAAARALATANIASTAVGQHALVHIAPVIAAGIERRFRVADAPPLDIILCENLKNGGAYMRGLVRNHLAPEWHDCLESRVGFVEASIGRMVPVMTAEQQAKDILAVSVEPYCELPVDAAGFRGPIPAIHHLKPAPNFEAYVERKLFVHNLTHAVAAYLGHLRGYAYIYEAIRDPAIRAVVEGAGAESCAALVARHHLAREELDAHVADLVHRYHNQALADQIARVARDPVRKLGPNDRLVGAGRLCVAHDIAPERIALAIAAAMLYDNPDGPATQTVQSLLQTGGVEAVLTDICETEPHGALGLRVVEAFHQLQRNKGL